ncbi:uncharacterized protein VTP21DRAFT_11422 [Calcarisporiella thermophila]|uniref:uncharacterized protein n=1 Tax=Calcarisporiella thermophila TaxID=911321 RepID=UPI0037441186
MPKRAPNTINSAPSAPTMAEFDPTGELLALSVDHRLRILESDSMRYEYSAEEAITCISWTSLNLNEASRKRRKRKAASEAAPEKAISLGLVNGSVVICSARTAKEQKCLKPRVEGSIVDIKFTRDGSRAYGLIESGHVVEWETEQGESLASWDSGVKNAKCLGLIHGESRLLVAGERLVQFELETKKVIKGFAETDLPITHMCISDDGTYCIYVAETQLSIWNLDDDTIKIVTLPSRPIRLAFSSNQPIFLILTDEGTLVLFSAVSLEQMSIRVEGTPVIAGGFSERNNDIVIAWGKGIKLTLERVRYMSEETSEFIGDVTLTREMAKSAPSTHKDTSEEELEPTLEEKLQGIERVSEGEATSNNPSPLSLKLRTPGVSIHEEIMDVFSRNNGNDAAIRKDFEAMGLGEAHADSIRATVARLPEQIVRKLALYLAGAIEERPSRAMKLVGWLRALLMMSSGCLLSDGEVFGRLSKMQRGLAARRKLHQKLMGVQGRLDLVIAQITAREQVVEGNEDEGVLIDGEVDEDEEVEAVELESMAGLGSEDGEGDEDEVDEELVGDADAFEEEEELESEVEEEEEEEDEDEDEEGSS